MQVAPEAGDRYGVVDDLQAGHVILVLDRWPTVDTVGHLVFSGAAVTRHVPVDEFQGVVDQQRGQAGQPAADRVLRVGDVFWVRAGDDTRLNHPGQWQVLDVTGSARRAARAAQLVAANPALRASAVDAARAAVGTGGEQGGRAPGERPATGAASPAV